MPDTHYAFTVGKDGLVKYWDADRWELLLTLEGHKAEVWVSLCAPDSMLAAWAYHGYTTQCTPWTSGAFTPAVKLCLHAMQSASASSLSTM